MKLQEVYKNQLINNLKLFNVVLGLSTIGNPSIRDFLEASTVSYKKICRNRDNKKKAVATIMELSSDIMILSEDCSFYNLNLMDLSIYERLDFLLDKVLKFSSADSIQEFFKKDFMETIGYLQAIEMNLGENIKTSTSYIVIRNFLVLCNLRMYRYAYYYAVFIRCQIFISEGLSPRIEYSDLYKSELSLAIQSERKKFSKNIKKKISKNVRDIANKVPLVNLEEKRDDRFKGEVLSAPVSNSNISLDGMNKQVNDFVENYKKEKYDVSPSERKENIKEGIKSAVNDAAKEVIDKGKEAGKSVYQGAKDVAKDKLETPLNVVKDKVYVAKSTINEAIGATNKEFDKNLKSIINSNHYHEDLEGLDNSHSFSKEVGNKEINTEEKAPKKSGKLSALRKKAKQEELAKQQELAKQEELDKQQNSKKKSSAIENLRKANSNGKFSSKSNPSKLGVDEPSQIKVEPSKLRVDEPSQIKVEPSKLGVDEPVKSTMDNLSKLKVDSPKVNVSKVNVPKVDVPKVNKTEKISKVDKSKDTSQPNINDDLKDLNNSSLFSASQSTKPSQSTKSSQPTVDKPSNNSVNLKAGQKARIRKTGSTTKQQNPVVEQKPVIEQKPVSKQENTISVNSNTSANNNTSSNSNTRKFVKARIRKETVRRNANNNSNVSNPSKQTANVKDSVNTEDKSELKGNRMNTSNVKNSSNSNPSNSNPSNYIGSSSFFS